jgi:hypothetical protein
VSPPIFCSGPVTRHIRVLNICKKHIKMMYAWDVF